MAEKIPCLFDSSLSCPKNCPLHEYNLQSFATLAEAYSLPFRAILALFADPDDAIGKAMNSYRYQGWSEEKIAQHVSGLRLAYDQIIESRYRTAHSHHMETQCAHKTQPE